MGDVATKSNQELTAPVVWKDEAKRIVYGPVLTPGEKDSDGDSVTAEKIEQVAHTFLETYGNLDSMHTLTTVARPVESYIAPADLVFEHQLVPKGSWIMGARVADEAVWKNVQQWQAGGFGGFSIMAVPKQSAEDVAQKREAVSKRVTLRDIEAAGHDWEVILVSLVDKPAVPSAKWLAVKREEPKFWDRFKDALLGTAEKAQEHDDEQEMEDMDAEEMKKVFGEVIDEKVKPLTDRMDALDKEREDAKTKEAEGKTPEGKEKENEGKEKESVGITEEQLELAAAGAAEKALSKVFGEFDKQVSSKRVSFKDLAESLTGQDGHVAEKRTFDTGRDAFGRPIAKDD